MKKEINYIDEYFKEKAQKVNFIELKDYKQLGLEMGEDIRIPLPLVADVLADGISKGNLEEKVDAEKILDGMIFLIGTDSEFEFKEDYIKILREYSEEIDDYIFFKGIKYLDQDLMERSEVYFRAIREMNPEHILGRFNYALALERIAQDMINDGEEIKGMQFLAESTYELESILDIDEKYPLAYYKLGYHYNFSNQYLKAKLMWEKYINLDNDDLRIQEVREQIDIIQDNVDLESGLTYLSYNRHEEALESFLKILPRHSEWWELRYLLGMTHAGLNNSQAAIDEYRIALELNSEVEDVYNELGIELFKQGDIAEAIVIFTKGIDILGDKYKLYFNRGLGYLQLDNYIKAKEDINKAHELNPVDENVLETKNQLENI